MEDNSYYGSYEENERKNPLFKILFVVIAITAIIVIIILIARAFGGRKVEKQFLTAGKTYFDENSKNLPESVGECNTVTLSYLINEKIIKNTDNYDSCDDTATYIKVCKLESGDYHYTPVIKCGTKDDTVFGDYKEGKESDLTADSSDLRFTYKGEVYSTQNKQYYPGNKTNEKEVTELYTSAPATDYTYKGEAVSNAAKWYTQSTGTSYWNNGSYSSTAPTGYPTQGIEGNAVTRISLTAPATASYRTIKQQLVYRTRSVSTPVAFQYLCYSRTLNYEMLSTTPCGVREDSYKEYKAIYYTCDGTTKVEKSSSCASTDWSAWTTNACTTSGTVECESKAGYIYTDRTWQWYVTGTYKSYYPSGSATAVGENTYYVDSPKAGYVKDSSTVTTAYRYYKLVNSDTTSTSDGEWVEISDKYVDLDELLKSFKDKGFEVTSLSDIKSNDKIRYKLKLEYAERQ